MGDDLFGIGINAFGAYKAPMLEQYNAAQRNFKAVGEMGLTSYNLPKLHYSYVVEFILSEAAKKFIMQSLRSTHSMFSLQSLACFVRATELPSCKFNVEKLNQYNRTRLNNGKVDYKPIRMDFFDTKDSAAFKLIDAYRKFYYGDFFQKNPSAYNNDMVSSVDQFEFTGQIWGRSFLNQRSYSDQYFFQSINIYEIDNDTYTAHAMHNVYISDFTMARKTQDDNEEPATISVELQYEGLSNKNTRGIDAISRPTIELRTLLNATTGYNRSGFFKYFGEMDDQTSGVLSALSFNMAGDLLGVDLSGTIGDIFNGDLSVEGIRNIGSIMDGGIMDFGSGGDGIGQSMGLGNIFGDF